MTQVYRYECGVCASQKLQTSSGDPRSGAPECDSCGREMDFVGTA